MSDSYEVGYTSRNPGKANGAASRLRAPQFKALAKVTKGEVQAKWVKSPPDDAKEEFDEDVQRRVRALHDWIQRLTPLLSDVKTWAEELGWSVRIVDKTMEDSEIGRYCVPGLMLQQDFTRAALEPIGHLAPEAQGVAEFYILPTYDDIARLYFEGDRWNLHYMAPTQADVSRNELPEPKPFSKKLLRDVLNEMKKHVA